jgi:hypothetical protein
MPFDDGPRTRILHYSTGFEQPELVDAQGRRLRLEPEREGRFRCELALAGELSFFLRDARSGEEDRPPGGGTYRLERDRRESWLESGALLDVEPRRLEGALVDAHTHPYRRESGDRFAFDPAALLQLPRHGVRAALTMLRGPLGEQRRSLGALSRAHPWLVPLAWPRVGVDDPAEVERLLVAGFRGLKLHPYLDQRAADDPAMDPYLALARRHRVPVQVHSAADDASRPERVLALAARFPEVPVVMVHSGLGIAERGAVLEAARERPNLYLETSWVPADWVVAAIETVDSSRTLFGTDATVDGPLHYEQRSIAGPGGAPPMSVPELLAHVRERVHPAAFANWSLLTAVRLYRLRFAALLCEGVTRPAATGTSPPGAGGGARRSRAKGSR